MTRSPDYDEGYRRAIEDASIRLLEELERVKGSGNSMSLQYYRNGVESALSMIRVLTPPPRPEAAACTWCFWRGPEPMTFVHDSRCPIHGSAAKPAACARCKGRGVLPGVPPEWLECPECKGGA